MPVLVPSPLILRICRETTMNRLGYKLLAAAVLAFSLSLVSCPQTLLTQAMPFATLAFAMGAAVGAAELSSRYRDEPLQALLSPFGLLYVTING